MCVSVCVGVSVCVSEGQGPTGTKVARFDMSKSIISLSKIANQCGAIADFAKDKTTERSVGVAVGQNLEKGESQYKGGGGGGGLLKIGD